MYSYGEFVQQIGLKEDFAEDSSARLISKVHLQSGKESETSNTFRIQLESQTEEMKLYDETLN